MRSGILVLVALILFSGFLILSSAGGFVSRTNAQSPAQGYSLSSLQTFNQYGQFSVNETLTGSGTSSPLSSVTFGFPTSFQNNVASISSRAEIGSTPIQTTTSKGVSNGIFYMTLTFGQSIGGSNSTVQLGFWVLNSFQPVNTTGYTAPALASPFVNIHLDSINNTINFPYETTYVSNSTTLESSGFTASTTYVQSTSYIGQIQHWTNTSVNTTPSLRSFPISIYSVPSSTGALDFTSVTREITIGASGQITVTDTLNVKNLGLNTISTLEYTPLTSATSIIAVPSREPPLSNVQNITVSSNQLSLNSTNQVIQPESSATLIFKYSLSSLYWNLSSGVYTVSIPTTVPVGALVDQFQISSTNLDGIIVIGHQLFLAGNGTDQIGSGTATLKFRVGVSSASVEALPIATILFVGVFAASIVFRPRSESGEDVTTILDGIIRTIEDKVSSTNELLSDLRSKGSSLNRNELAVARSRIDDVRSKTNSRLGALRSQLPQSVTTAIQAGLNEILAIDRDFDREMKELLNGYDQYASRRMKEETFLRLQQSNSRKLQNTTNSLIDRTHDIREEYESEK